MPVPKTRRIREKKAINRNNDLLDYMSGAFTDDVGGTFKKIFRGKTKGFGITLNDKYLMTIERDLKEENRKIDLETEKDTLKYLGLEKYGTFNDYLRLNPENLSSDEIFDISEKYSTIYDKRNIELKQNAKREIKGKAMEIQIAEIVRQQQEGVVPRKLMTGVQVDFLGRVNEDEARLVGTAFSDVLKCGRPKIRPELMTDELSKCIEDQVKSDLLKKSIFGAIISSIFEEEEKEEKKRKKEDERDE